MNIFEIVYVGPTSYFDVGGISAPRDVKLKGYVIAESYEEAVGKIPKGISSAEIISIAKLNGVVWGLDK